MKKLLRKAALMLAVLSLSAASVSCGDSDKKEEESSGNLVGNLDDFESLKEEDMPFGATLAVLKNGNSGAPITIEYDYRFMSEDEAMMISKYISALGDRDAEMLESVAYPEYLNSVLELLGAESALGFAEIAYEGYKGYIGSDFSFNYIIATDMYTEDNYDFTSYDQILYGVAPDAEISDKKLIYLDCLYSSDNGSGSFSSLTGNDVPVCIYTIDGELYVLM